MCCILFFTFLGHLDAPKRYRFHFNAVEAGVLENEYQQSIYLTNWRRAELSKMLKIKEDHIRTWFQNRRQKQKLVDPDYIMAEFSVEKYERIIKGLPIAGHKEGCQGIPVNVTVPSKYAQSESKSTNAMVAENSYSSSTIYIPYWPPAPNCVVSVPAKKTSGKKNSKQIQICSLLNKVDAPNHSVRNNEIELLDLTEKVKVEEKHPAPPSSSSSNSGEMDDVSIGALSSTDAASLSTSEMAELLESLRQFGDSEFNMPDIMSPTNDNAIECDLVSLLSEYPTPSSSCCTSPINPNEIDDISIKTIQYDYSKPSTSASSSPPNTDELVNLLAKGARFEYPEFNLADNKLPKSANEVENALAWPIQNEYPASSSSGTSPVYTIKAKVASVGSTTDEYPTSDQSSTYSDDSGEPSRKIRKLENANVSEESQSNICQCKTAEPSINSASLTDGMVTAPASETAIIFDLSKAAVYVHPAVKPNLLSFLESLSESIRNSSARDGEGDGGRS